MARSMTREREHRSLVPDPCCMAAGCSPECKEEREEKELIFNSRWCGFARGGGVLGVLLYEGEVCVVRGR